MRRLLLLVWLLGLLLPAVAQTQLDPNFLAQDSNAPADYVTQALQLADGSRVLLGSLDRADGTVVANHLAKYLPSGQPDVAFNTRVSQYSFAPYAIAEAPGNKLVVALIGLATLGSQTYYGLVRLLADGTVDAGFAPQPAALTAYGYSTVLLVQADGKIILTNDMALTLTQNSREVARLNADGTPDTSFNSLVPATLAGNNSTYINCLSQQPDGKLLVGGNVAVGTTQQAKLIRLLTIGTADPSFAYPTTLSTPQALALQPDGKVLVAIPYSNRVLVRLLSTGAIDPSFQAPANLTVEPFSTVNPTSIQVQPDGRILVGNVDTYGTLGSRTAHSFIVRLLANGTRDTSWQPPAFGDYQAAVYSLQLLPNGQLLVAGDARLYAPVPALPTPVAVLGPNGALTTGFAPVVQQGGAILSMTLQSDGRILAGGNFSEINGTVARNLARFNPDGTLDVPFTTNAAVYGGYVASVALQPDGKMLIGGSFINAGGQPRAGVARLLASGLLDPTFTPALQPNSPLFAQRIHQVALLPNGQVIAGGELIPAGGSQEQYLVMFGPTGTLDPGFQPPTAGSPYGDVRLAVQPDGKIITANLVFPNSRTLETVARLLPDGSLDPSFARLPAPGNGNSPATIYSLALYPDGRVLLGGSFSRFSSINTSGVARLLPNGQSDATYLSSIGSFQPHTVALQPNGRILAAGVNYGNTTNPPMIRLLSDGSVDTSFDRSKGPAHGSYVTKLQVQADGGILVAGGFKSVAGQPLTFLVRLLDANVLRVGSPQAEPITSAWPVPTHDVLHLALDAAAHPQRVQLLDVLGHVVRTQAAPAANMTLPTAGLPAGTYLLRVDYASGVVTRRVVVE